MVRTLGRMLAAAIAVGLAGCSVSVSSDTPVASNEPAVVVYLLRHAEALSPPPEDEPRNPPLNVMGQERADALARLLSSESIDHVFSTEYHRTQETAAPLATALGLEVEPYDPRALEDFAAQLRATPGRHVVLGHSNTTPALVENLGGQPGEPIDEQVEYDRLYTVIIGADGEVTTLLHRYGAPLPEDWEERAGTRR